MATIEELLMDMIDDGPPDATSASVPDVAADADLVRDLRDIHAQTALLAMCKEPVTDATLAALRAQQDTLRGLFARPVADPRLAALWSGAVVVIASCISIAASNLVSTSQPRPETPARHGVQNPTEHVVPGTQRNVVLEPRRPDVSEIRRDGGRVAAAPATAPVTARLESSAERVVLERHRTRLLESASHASGMQAYRIYRDVYRVSMILHDTEAARKALLQAQALAAAEGAAVEVDRCTADLKALDQRHSPSAP